MYIYIYICDSLFITRQDSLLITRYTKLYHDKKLDSDDRWVHHDSYPGRLGLLFVLVIPSTTISSSSSSSNCIIIITYTYTYISFPSAICRPARQPGGLVTQETLQKLSPPSPRLCLCRVVRVAIVSLPRARLHDMQALAVLRYDVSSARR